MSRRKARETAFKMLFQMDVGNNELQTAKYTLEDSGLKGGYKNFALDLVCGVRDNRFELQEYLSKFTKGWQITRLAAVDRNLAEMAIYEIKYTDTPANIVINEAVELAKIYGAAESPAFVNAVLDAFYNKVIVEADRDYLVDEKFKAEYMKQISAAKRRAAMMAAENTEFDTAESEQKLNDNAEVSNQTFAAENQIIKRQGFRKIKKADISEKEQIKAESVLEDKKRIYGSAAFLTAKDLRKARENGELIPNEVLEDYYKADDGKIRADLKKR